MGFPEVSPMILLWLFFWKALWDVFPWNSDSYSGTRGTLLLPLICAWAFTSQTLEENRPWGTYVHFEPLVQLYLGNFMSCLFRNTTCSLREGSLSSLIGSVCLSGYYAVNLHTNRCAWLLKNLKSCVVVTTAGLVGELFGLVCIIYKGWHS